MLDERDYEKGRAAETKTETDCLPENDFVKAQQEAVPAQNEQYRNFIVRYNQSIHGPVAAVSDGTFQVINDYFGVVYVPAEDAGEIEINSYTYNSVPKCYTYMDVESLNASGVGRLHDHPYLQLRGRGTLVAVIDSGIDYRHPAFVDGEGSRILCLWDQTIQAGASEQVPFGRVFTKEEIDRALAAEDPFEIVPSRDTNGHGTMVASVAAGKRIPEEYFSGAAPEASLIVIRLKPAKKYLREFYLYSSDTDIYQEDDIMLALSFALRCAREYQMPLSVCIGLGSSQGAHQGYSPLSQYINSTAMFAQNCISVAAGNEGAARHHYYGRLEDSSSEETVELRVGENTDGFTMEFWGSPPEIYHISVQSPTGEDLSVSTALKGITQKLRFVFVETRVLVNYVPIERQSGNTLVYFRFLHPAPGIWRLTIKERSANHAWFHIWLPVQGLIAPDTYFLQSSPYYTVTSPGDAAYAVTPTAYRAGDGSLFLEASRGFTPAEAVKPCLAAPGVEIRTALLGGGFGTASGTSLAAAQTAGIAALLFEWAIIRENEPFFTGNGVKNYLQNGARREDDMQYPNQDWGFGKVDLYRTFELLT